MKKRSYLLHLNFKMKLLLMISFLMISLVLLISWLNYSWHAKHATRQTINQTQQIIEQIGENIDIYIDELFRLTLSPYYNDEIMSELGTPLSSPNDMLYKRRKIESFLASVMTLPRNEILRVYILTDEDIYSYTRTPYEMSDYNNYKEASWYLKALQTTEPVFIPIHSEEAFGKKKTQIFSIARKIRSKINNDQTLGVIKVDADYTGIKTICDKVHFENKGALFVITDNKDIVYQNNGLDDWNLVNEISLAKDNGDYICTIEGTKYLINITSLEYFGLKIIAVNSYQEILKSARTNLSKTIILMLLCVFISILFLIIFIQRFFQPLYRIINSMKIVQTGDLSVQVPIENNDEISYLARAFNSMIFNLKEIMDKNTELIKEVYETQYLHKESQYNALCSQIKPHFLHNTLNTISLLIKCDERENAIAIIENFSFFLRGIMNTDKEISLETELQIVESYLSILIIRYGDKLNYHIKIDESIRSFKIPALTLQPIVENAVKHGCERKRGNTLIEIYSITENNSLNLFVKDNGIGMDEETYIQLCRELENECHTDLKDSELLNSSLGLKNVHRRLRLKFGNSAGLTIKSSIEEGTTVTIKIPIQS